MAAVKIEGGKPHGRPGSVDTLTSAKRNLSADGLPFSGLPLIRALMCSAVFVLRGSGSIGKNRSAELPQFPAKHCD